MNQSLRQAFYALCTVLLAQFTFAQTDLLPTAITSPTNGCLLSASQNVEVRVARGDNFTPGSVNYSVTVTTTVNGTTYPAETSSVSLVPYQAALISGSSAPIDFSAPGIYDIQCVISYGGTIAANDTITTSVISSVLPGSLSADETVCEGDNGQINLTGNSGEIVQWEESIDGGINWSALGNTTNSLNYTNIAQTTSYRVLSQGEFDTLIQAGGDIFGFEFGQQSGWAVALDNSGTRVAIGEFETNGGEGSVRVLDYNGATWTQVGDTLRGSAVNRQFGFNVALSDDGNTLAVGIQRSDSIGTDVGAAAIYSWDGSNWSEINMVFGSIQDSLFGRYMDLSDNGQFLVVGSPHNEVNGTNAGAVYSYSYQTDVPVWVQLGLDIDGEAAGDQSGWSVSLSSDGSRMAIGAIRNDDVGVDAGHVRVYEWDGISWFQLGLDIDGEAAGDNSGWSVSLSADGSRLAIGATGNDGVGAGAGHVRVYEWDGISWVQLGLDIDGEALGDGSGVSVDLSSDGSRIAIGAENNDAGGAFAGHVRIYQWDGVGWIQLGQDLDGEGIGDYFGFSVSFSSDGDRLAIGAPENDGGASDAGHVRVYDWDSVLLTWEQLGLDIDGEAAGDGSGNSVSLSSDGNRLAIGAPGSDGAGGFTGDVRVYDWDSVSLSWVQLGLAIDGEGADDFSGSSVSLSSDGNRLAIGAILNDGNGADAGHVRLYDWDGTSLSWVQLGLDIDGEAAADLSGKSISLSSDGRRLAIGAYGNVGNGLETGHVRVYELDSFTGFLTLNDTLYGNPGDHFGGSVAIDADGNRLAVGSPKWSDGVQDSVGRVDYYRRSLDVWNSLGSGVIAGRGLSEFGSDISLNAQGDRLVVGSYLDDLGGVNTGATMVYQRVGAGNWSQIGSDLRGEDFGDGAGIAVGMDNTGDRIVVGAPFNPGGGNFSGQMRMYELLGSNWVQVTPDLDGDAPNDFFGFGVAISGNGSFVASGSGSNDYAGIDAGLTRIYEVNTLPSACGSAYSNTTTITVDAAVIAGNLSSDAVVCGGNNTGNLALTGIQGTVVNWELSVDGGLSWSPIVNVSQSYVYNNLTTTTQFRVIVTNGSCGNDTSNTVTITVDPPVVGGNLTGSATVCASGNNGSITLGGEVGTVIGWETSIDDGGTWTSLANTTNTQNYTDLVTTTWYRAEVQSGTCGNAYSDIAIVTVDDPVIAGLLSSDSTVCYLNNTGTLTLSGTVGITVAWESNNGSGWTIVANAGTTYTYSGLLDTTQYRFIASNGACGNDTSNVVTINVDPNLPPDAGIVVINNTLSSDTTVCAGGNTDTLRLIDMVGSVIHWEQSQDGGSTWFTLANTDTFQVFIDLPTTTYYRAFVQGGACGIGYSDTAIVRVDNISNGGLLEEDMVVCAGSNEDTLILSGFIGDIISWEIDSGLGYQSLGVVGDSLIFSDLDTTTSYRVEVKNGVCPSVYSNAVTVSVTPTTVGGTLITATPTVCEGDNSGTILLTNYVGNITRWEYSEDNGSTWTPIIETSESIAYLNILRETQYRVFIQASGCPDVYSSTLTIFVDEPSVAGILASDAVVCDSVHSGTLTLSGSLGNSIVWQSVDTGAVNDSIQLGGTIYDYANLTNTTRFIAIVTNGVCPSDSSNVVGVLTNFTEADFAFDNVCIGDEMFFADESFIKDGFAVQRNWDFGNGTGSTVEDPVVLFEEVGTYDVQLSILSQGLCIDTIIQTVEVYPLPDSTITNLGDSAFCDGDSTILRGEDGLSYLWTTGDSTQFLTVTVEDFYGLTVTDSNLCVNSSEVFIEVWPLPQAEAGNDTTISLGQTTILEGSGGEQYMWDPPTFLDDFMLQNPLSSPDSSIQYTVLVTDSNGCQNTDSVLITVLIDYLFTPSNLVTPNGDGFNDTWFVENLVDYPACEVLIFNEFGEIVFQEREYDNDWAGEFQGARLPDGTYYYIITCPDAAALYKGHVTILSQQ